MEIDPDLIVPEGRLSMSLGEGAPLPWSSGAQGYYEQITQAIAYLEGKLLDAGLLTAPVRVPRS